MSRFLLALDQATETTGFCMFDGEKLIAHGQRSFSGKDYIDRICQLRQWVAKLIDASEHSMEIVIEDIQLQSFGKSDIGLQTYKKLAHLQGALMTLFHEKNVTYHVVMASSWKHTCGIKGRVRAEQKRAAQDFVKHTYGLNVQSDEADSICIAHHALHTGITSVNSFDWS